MIRFCVLALFINFGFAADREVLHKLEVDDRERTYWMFVPDKRPPADGWPCVLVLHGGGGTGKGIIPQTHFSTLAAKENFVAVYPDGYHRNWNDGRIVARSRAHTEKYDDVKFISALLDDLSKRIKLDPLRIYATGISNGGCFSYYLAARLADRLAAIAPVCAGIADPFHKKFSPSEPVSVLMLQGVDDPLVPYEGGKVAWNRGRMLGTNATVELLLKANGIKNEPEIVEGPNAAPNDGCRVTIKRWTGGKLGSGVTLYRIDGGGHTWPGGRQYLPRFIIGRVCRDFDATTVIWDFFKSHPKQKEPFQ